MVMLAVCVTKQLAICRIEYFAKITVGFWEPCLSSQSRSRVCEDFGLLIFELVLTIIVEFMYFNVFLQEILHGGALQRGIFKVRAEEAINM